MLKTTKFKIAAAVVLAGFGSAAWADIVIATAGPMTGQYASFGEQMRRPVTVIDPVVVAIENAHEPHAVAADLAFESVQIHGPVP